MSQSLARVIIHVVFSVKHRAPLLKETEIRTDLYAYIASVLRENGCDPILVNGVEDHVHVLCNLSRTIAISKLVQEAKSNTSKWMKKGGARFAGFAWQSGYGVFSVSQSKVEDARRYIADQEDHHRRVSFQDEFRALCRKHGIKLDERCAWD